MLIIPAIDIKNGKCVRLIQGDPDRETIYSSDPVAMALKFQDLGARLIHIVDLDGAFQGFPVNRDIVVEISKSLSIPVEIGGGIRSHESISYYLEAGIKRIILGTAVVNDGFKEFIDKYGKSIIVGIDAKNSKVAINGWKKLSNLSALDLIKKLQYFGVHEIIYTDISTDGMLTGPNYESIEKILSEVPDMSLIASGGVATIMDVRKLGEIPNPGLKGCIIGKAVYDGRIDLKEALALFDQRLTGV